MSLRHWLFAVLAVLLLWYFVAAAMGVRPFPFVHAIEWLLIDVAVVAIAVLLVLRRVWRA